MIAANEIKTGLHKDVPADVYRSWDAMNYSRIKLLDKSLELFKWRETNPPKPTKAMEFGTLCDIRLHQPEIFAELYAIAPKLDMRTTAGREAAAKWESENSGKNGIDPADEEASRRVVEAVMSHAEASKIMAAGDPQVAGLWVDKETGVLCKMRLDWLSAVISDLKVSVDVEADEFLKSMGTYGYHIQAAFYQDGYAAITGQRLQFVWIVAESKEPYRVRVYKANNQCLTAGRIAYRRGLYRYQLSQKANDWRDPQIIEEIGVPSWIAYAEGLEREQGNEF